MLLVTFSEAIPYSELDIVLSLLHDHIGVDARSGLSGNAHIYETEDGVRYNIVLNMTGTLSNRP